MTRAYRVVIPNSVWKTLASIEGPLRSRILARIDALSTNPRPRGTVKIGGPGGTFRVRVGSWRIVYDVLDAELVVLLVKIGHRREVYR